MERPTLRDRKVAASFTSLTSASSAHITIPEEEDSLLGDGFQGDRIKVALRVRPMFSIEELEGRIGANNDPQNCLGDALLLPSSRRARHQLEERAWEVEGGDTIVQKKGAGRKTTGRNRFTMDYIFDEDSDTSTIYEEIARPIVHSVASGRHGTIFAYGQTGSGKTYTMQGDHTGCENEGMGLTQMAMVDLFEFIDSNSDWDWRVSVQYYEIYNEEVRDLIAPGCDSAEHLMRRSSTPVTVASSTFSIVSPSSSRRRSMFECVGQDPAVYLPTLKVREDQEGNVVVEATEKVVKNAEECIRVLHEGNVNRASAATNANKHSSRSHAIFRVTLRSHPLKGDQMSRVSVLNLVDLAGSENARQSGATSVRKREGGKINQSLLSLSRVIHSLSLSKEERPQHIGFRDSRLTRILQPHLSGNACISILCCVTICKYNSEETRSTLKFASNAKEIKIRPIVNEYVDEKEGYMRLLKEVETLKASLRVYEERYGESAAHTVDTVSSVGSPAQETPIHIVGVFGTNAQPPSSFNQAPGASTHREVSHAPLVPHQSTATDLVDSPQSEEHFGSFPLREVELTRADSNLMDEMRVNFLEERIENTEALVARIMGDLNKSRHSMLESLTRNVELQEQLEELQQDVDDKTSRESILSGWYFPLCIMLYASGLQDLFVASVIFFWLALQSLNHSNDEDEA
mmetsp:Transcript_23141/g.54752  ORF Transcript_23141/g.54752 Transcript_23141/m.54752 type:complete len:688 (-) Transcript_23141:469-2532(-)|eukprot:CAMPEP_0168824416 /NCGR_PEP_ID=MMETSP0726-20121227/11081_1 /TAXON_ID=265536 /ORGANISM="Amphiprora sp., Strain CCMP467" /LENGTH=687 /DNA_ID=CAMNT_0008877413 /DNA_START=216 /DNA_END=2279 /DNA_ORIENTATION=+